MATTEATQKQRKPSQTVHEVVSALTLRAILTRLVLLAIGLLLLLALISHNPDDTFVLEGGLREFATVTNWIGLLGARLSGTLLQWLGFASFVAAVTLQLCACSRFVGPALTGGPALLYLLATGLITVGAAMLLGIFPEFGGALADRFNVAGIPGGVLGQKLTAPGPMELGGGWLALVMNTAGCGIVSSLMILIGTITLYWFDWHGHFLRRFFPERKAKATTPEKENDTEPQTETEAGEPISAKQKQKQKREEWRAAEERKLKEKQEKAEAEAKKASQVAPTVEPVEPAPVKKPAKAPPAVPAPAATPAKPLVPFKLPGNDLLSRIRNAASMTPKEVNEKKRILQDTLESFGIDALVGDSTCGPRVTLYEIKPAPGIRVEKISSLANNFAMNLRAESLRILTPIPGRDSVGIEVPNNVFGPVSFRDLLNSPTWTGTKAAIPVSLGKNIAGQPVILDLADAPHLLIAGATGSGKSVCMNALILSLLFRFKPDELKLVMVDPKVVELSVYNPLPHLVAPVVSEVKKVPLALRWAVAQMEWRYKVLAKVGVRNLEGFNNRKPAAEVVLDEDGQPIPARLPFLVIIIDELADIMMTAKADVETSLARIAQLGRAAGIHAVVATQRPSVNVITGIIKANFPTRIAFQVSSVVDSRTIIDGKGAEALLGKGDMLFKSRSGRMDRVQGAMVSDEEIEKVIDCVITQAPQAFSEDIFSPNAMKMDDAAVAALDPDGAAAAPQEKGFVDVGIETMEPDGDDALMMRSIQVIVKDRRATTSYLQRSLRIGYNRAATMIEELENRGIIGPQIGTAPRRILVESMEEAIAKCKQGGGE